MAVVLADVLEPRRVILALEATKRDEALREIASILPATTELAEPEKLFAQVLSRERATSTFVGHGVAFPHARTDLVTEIILGIGRSVAGVEFGDNGERANLIFLIAVPQRMVTDYLVCVGALARMTREEATRQALLQAATAEELVELLREGSLLLK